MGRKEQRERDRKRAASSCVRLDSLGFCSAKRTKPAGAGTDNDSGKEELGPKNSKDLLVVDPPEQGPSGAGTSTADVPVRQEKVIVAPSTSSACSLLQTTSQNDIGAIFRRAGAEAGEQCEKAVDQLSDGEKYALLKHHRCPPDQLPSSFLGGCKRSFQKSWLQEYPWMVYSNAVDGAFCISCALFCPNRCAKGQFVNVPFRNWHKKNQKCHDHQTTKYHQEALQVADEFSIRIEHPEVGVVALINNRLAENIERNRRILKCIADAVLYCGRQCIALRGHREALDVPGNHGNFLSLVQVLGKYDETLKQHLLSPTMANVTYMSPQTQNELLAVIGQHIILRDLLEEVKAAKFFTILADEVTSTNIEHLAICVRFVDAQSNIREEFLTFLQLERITGKHLSDAILNFLRENSLSVENIRGQGYDGASNMSSGRVGVQALIQNKAPLATYVHCSGHCLNLVISYSCSLPEVRNVLDILKHCLKTFRESPKKAVLLEKVVSAHLPDTNKRKALLDLCRTRWAERHSAYQHFYQAYMFIVEALEVIGYRMHLDTYGADFKDWENTARSEAQQLLASITRFDFLVVFLSIYFYLSHLAGITVKLQGRTIDIIAAHRMITDIKEVYSAERADIDQGFSKIYTHAVRMAEKVGSSPAKPRSFQSLRQQNRSNPPAESIEEYYKRSCAIPFLDHIIAHLDSRFSALTIKASSLLCLVPSIICAEDVVLTDAVEVYKDDLPSPELLDLELIRWKAKYQRRRPEECPDTLAAAIKECDATSFPNLWILLQIACTLPVTSCECERSASVLRRLRNYMRSVMAAERQANLALMHIHYTKFIDLDEVVTIFARLHPRRLELDSLIKAGPDKAS